MSTAETIDWLADLEERFARSSEERLERRLRLGGAQLVLRSAGARMLETVVRAFAHLPPDTGDGTPLVVHLWESRGAPATRPALPVAEGELPGTIYYHEQDGFRMVCQPGLRTLSALDAESRQAWFWTEDAATMPFWEAAAPLRQILHWWLGPRGVGLLHGAAVGTAEGGVLLVGRGGSGKSTSALSCLESNLLYAADDYVAVEEGEVPWVHSLYSSGKLEPAHASRLPHLDLPPALGGDEDEKVVFYVHERYPARTCEGFPLRAVLAPRITGPGEHRVVPLAPAAALRALAPSTLLQLHPSDPQAFASMARLLRQVPAYSLELGHRIDAIPAAIEQFLDGLAG